jgi:hypothetical protein
LRSREPLYAKADITLSTGARSPDQAAMELLRLIEVPDSRKGGGVSPTLSKERV